MNHNDEKVDIGFIALCLVTVLISLVTFTIFHNKMAERERTMSPAEVYMATGGRDARIRINARALLGSPEQLASVDSFPVAVIPEGRDWQYDVTFPDDNEDITLSRLGFMGFHDQGTVYIATDSACSSFNLYINDVAIDTSSFDADSIYQMNIGSVAIDGVNSIQISDLEEGSVRVCISYPSVSYGTLEGSGINVKAIELIDAIMSADVDNGLTGAQLAVIRHGQIVYENSWGQASTDTVYDISDDAEMFTTTYAEQYLLTRNRLVLDEENGFVLEDDFMEDSFFSPMELTHMTYSQGDLSSNAADLARLASLMLTNGGYGNVMYFSEPFIPQGYEGTHVIADPSNDMVIVFLTDENDNVTLSLEDVASILSIGLDSEYVSNSIWISILDDMIADELRTLEASGSVNNQNDPRWASYNSLVQVWTEYTE